MTSPAWCQVLTVLVGTPSAAGHLGQGEHAGVAESLLAAAQLVVVADVADDEPVEGAAFAAGQAAVVEDAGDLGVGVVVEQLVDGGDGGGGGLADAWAAVGGTGRVRVWCWPPGRRTCAVMVSRVRVTVTSVSSSRAMRLRSRAGVAGSFQMRGQVGDELADPGFLLVGELPGGAARGPCRRRPGRRLRARRAVFQSASRVSATSRLAGSTAR